MNKHKKTCNDAAASIWMSHSVFCQIMSSIGARLPESGGILLGPIGSNHITAFHFDGTASCSGVTYTPDHVTLSKLMDRAWLPAGVDMKGFVHSHPGNLDRLSDGDMSYIRRLLDSNADLNFFAAPIVIPNQFRLRPIVVMRNQPMIQRSTRLRFF